MTRRQRIELRNRVERLGEVFDWSNLVRHYDEAHRMALDRIGAQDGGGGQGEDRVRVRPMPR